MTDQARAKIVGSFGCCLLLLSWQWLLKLIWSVVVSRGCGVCALLPDVGR